MKARDLLQLVHTLPAMLEACGVSVDDAAQERLEEQLGDLRLDAAELRQVEAGVGDYGAWARAAAARRLAQVFAPSGPCSVAVLLAEPSAGAGPAEASGADEARTQVTVLDDAAPGTQATVLDGSRDGDGDATQPTLSQAASAPAGAESTGGLRWSLSEDSSGVPDLVFCDDAAAELLEAGQALPSPAGGRRLRFWEAGMPWPAAAGGPELVVAEVPALAAWVHRFELAARLRMQKYEVLKSIGQGGFGEVFLAEHTVGRQRVAIKVLHPRHAQNAQESEEFRGEWRRVVEVKSPNIVEWKGFDEMGAGTYFFVMELLEGMELSELLAAEKKLSEDRTGKILLGVLDALRSAHAARVVHLDLKPDNIFVERGPSGQASDERAKVLDFGIGQFVDAEPGPAAGGGGAIAADLAEAVDDGTLVANTLAAPRGGVQRCRGCTPGYASPEQAEHLFEEFEPRALDGRSDLYSLGVVGFRMLSGRMPWDRSGPPQADELLRQHLDIAPRKLRSCERSVSPELANFIDRCLIKDRDRRWQDAEQAYQALRAVVYPPKWKTALRFGWKVAAGMLLLFGVWYSFFREAPEKSFVASVVAADGTRGGLKLRSLGPSTPALQIGLGQAAGVGPATLLLSDGKEATRWGLNTAGDGVVVEYRGPPNEKSRDEFILQVAGQPPWVSQPFLLNWIPETAVRVRTPALRGWDPDLHPRVDPVDARLELRVLGLRDDEVGEVRILTRKAWRDAEGTGAEDSRALGVEISEAAEQLGVEDLRYRVLLEELGLEDGPHELFVRVRVTSGSVHDSPSLPLDLLSGKVELRDVALKNGDAAGVSLREFRIADGKREVLFGDTPLVEFRMNRAGRVCVEVRDEANALIGTAKEHTVSVDAAGKVQRVPIDVKAADTPVARTYTGVVVVKADDARVVYREDQSGGRNLDSKSIPFRFDVSDVELSLRVGGGGLPSEQWSGGDLRYTAGDRVEVRVRREGTASFFASVDLVHWPSGETQNRRSATLTGSPPVDTLSFELRRDGPYELRVRAFREEGDAAEQEFRGVLVRDTSEPSLQGAGFEGAVIRGDSGGWPSSTLRAADEAGWAADELKKYATELSLQWSLWGPQGEMLSLASEPSPKVMRSGQELALSFPELAAVLADQPDGAYRWEVRGTDVLGRSATQRLGFELAREGPALSFEQPALIAGQDWTPNDQNQCRVQVLLDDPNGLATTGDGAPYFRVRNTDSGREFIGPLSNLGGARWVGEMSVDDGWSRAEVELAVFCADRFANSRVEQRSLSFSTIEVGLLPHVRVAFDGYAVADMRLVRGNTNERDKDYYGDFVFLGRSPELEAQAYQDAGLPPRRAEQSTGQISFPRTEGVESFYLDESEVSRAQFLDFLNADGGYLDARWWPERERSQDRRERHAQLRAAFVGRGNYPAVNLRWAEAFAYAGWVGKRLPSWVEWEYAVRDGIRYHVVSWQAAGQSPGQRAGLAVPYPGEINIQPIGRRSGTEPEGAWEVSRGADRKPGSGVRNLCSNVSEWTATPADFGGFGGGKGRGRVFQLAREYASEFLRPHALTEQASYYVIGSSYRSRSPVFERDPDWFDRDKTSEQVGFRCAMDATEVAKALKGEGRRTLEGVD